MPAPRITAGSRVIQRVHQGRPCRGGHHQRGSRTVLGVTYSDVPWQYGDLNTRALTDAAKRLPPDGVRRNDVSLLHSRYNSLIIWPTKWTVFSGDKASSLRRPKTQVYPAISLSRSMYSPPTGVST